MLHESRLLEWNMDALIKLEIPFVPLHDALLVPEYKLPVLQRIMNDNLELYREILIEAGTRLKGTKLSNDHEGEKDQENHKQHQHRHHNRQSSTPSCKTLSG
jgi:hypothetical protein